MVSVINFVSVRFSSVTHIAQYVFRFLCSLFTRFFIKNCFDDRLYGIVFREPALRAQEICYRGVFSLSRLMFVVVSSRFCFVPSAARFVDGCGDALRFVNFFLARRLRCMFPVVSFPQQRGLLPSAEIPYVFRQVFS